MRAKKKSTARKPKKIVKKSSRQSKKRPARSSSRSKSKRPAKQGSKQKIKRPSHKPTKRPARKHGRSAPKKQGSRVRQAVPAYSPPLQMPVKKKGCPECKSLNIRYDNMRGETVCESCGTVLSESMIDVTQEWRAFDEDQRSRRVRTGAVLTPTKHDQGITTEIGKGRGELFKVASKKRAQYYRLTKWHKRLIKSRDRNLSFALSELQRLVSILNLSKAIHERVARLYQQAVNKGLVRGRSTESIIAALLYTTCREEGAPRTLDEISKAAGINKKDIGKTYRYIARKLKIRILPAKAQDYVPRVGSLLGLSERVQVRAVDVLDDASKYDVTSGKGPIGVAAAALYIAAVLAGEKKTQREVADVIGVTEVTIRNRYKEMVESLGIKDEVEERVKEDDDSRSK